MRADQTKTFFYLFEKAGASPYPVVLFAKAVYRNKNDFEVFIYEVRLILQHGAVADYSHIETQFPKLGNQTVEIFIEKRLASPKLQRRKPRIPFFAIAGDRLRRLEPYFRRNILINGLFPVKTMLSPLSTERARQIAARRELKVEQIKGKRCVHSTVFR